MLHVCVAHNMMVNHQSVDVWCQEPMPTIASCSRHVCHEFKCEFCCYENRFGTTCQVCLFANRPTPETPLQTMRVKSMMSCTPLQDRAGSRGRLKALTMVVSLTALAFFSRFCHFGNQQDLHFCHSRRLKLQPRACHRTAGPTGRYHCTRSLCCKQLHA